MGVSPARIFVYERYQDLQFDVMRAAGCETVYNRKASGVKRERRGLEAALANTSEHNVLLVWKLDSLTRLVKQLIR